MKWERARCARQVMQSGLYIPVLYIIFKSKGVGNQHIKQARAALKYSSKKPTRQYSRKQPDSREYHNQESKQLYTETTNEHGDLANRGGCGRSSCKVELAFLELGAAFALCDSHGSHHHIDWPERKRGPWRIVAAPARPLQRPGGRRSSLRSPLKSKCQRPTWSSVANE